MARDLIDAATGAMLGTMVGDAMGMPAKGLSPLEIQEEFGRIDSLRDGPLPAGEYTDDTEMTVGVCEALIAHKTFDLKKVAEQMATHFTPWRGYSSHVYGIMARVRQGHEWETLGSGSWSNGAAMRVAPIAVLYVDDPGLLEAAAAQARITDNHPNGVGGAVAQAMVISEAIVNGLFESRLDLDDLLDKLSRPLAEFSIALSDAFSRLRDLQPKSETADGLAHAIANMYPCDDTAVGSIPAALAAFLYTHSFEEAVIAAVNCGGDTDTIGAMAGAIAGAFYGAHAIPERLTAGLANDERGRDHVIELGRRLGALTRQRSGDRLELEDDF